MNTNILENAKQKFDFFETPDDHCKFIYDDCNHERELNVLDVCCGLGSLSKRFYDNNHNVTMIELNQEFIPFLKNTFPNANIINENFFELNLNKKFDVILCNPPFNTPKIKKIYRLFFVKLLSLISVETKLYFICPNMFIRNQNKIKLNDIFLTKASLYNEFIQENNFEPAIFQMNRYNFIQLDSLDFNFDRVCLKVMKSLNLNEEITEFENKIFMINGSFDIRFLRDIKNFKYTNIHCILLRITY